MNRIHARIAAAFVAAATALACAAAQAQQLRRLELNVFREDPANVAGRLKGFFEREGLDVKVTVTPNSTDQMRGLSKDTYHIASTAFDNVLGWSGREGAELVAVSQVIDSAVYPVFVRPEIKRWSDLRGRKLAVDAVDTAFALVLRRVLLDKGLDFQRGDYELVPVGQTALRLESMKKGDTFAAILTTPFDVQALSAGMVRLGDSREVLPNFPNTILAVNRAWAAKERAQLVGYLRAWLESLRWIRANHEEAVKLTATALKLNPKLAEIQVSSLSRSGAIDPAALAMALKLRNDFGLTPRMGPDISRYYDTSYYYDAARR